MDEEWGGGVGAVDRILDADVCTSVVRGGQEEESAASDFVVPLEFMSVCWWQLVWREAVGVFFCA